MNIDATLARACERVPGVVRAALVLLPDGFTIGRAGDADNFELEPLVRAVARCFEPSESDVALIEYLFALPEEYVVIQGGRRDPRLALGLLCSRQYNAPFVRSAARLAMGDVEAEVDLAKWGL